jgi:hypothetical protein
MGLGGYDSDFVGIDGGRASGMPDWRHPTMPEAVVISPMDEYSAHRKELGVRDASDVFGAAPATPRTHSSPYSI